MNITIYNINRILKQICALSNVRKYPCNLLENVSVKRKICACMPVI